MSSHVTSARIFEVGPRDGLQNESIVLKPGQKIALIEKLADAGLKDIEIGSFVHPRWVPQMANTDEVAEQLSRLSDVRYWALVPNEKGLERALETGIEHIAVFMSSSETHNQKNVNRSIEESLTGLKSVIKTAKDQGCTVRAYVSTVFGCPYEGEIDFGRVLEISAELLEFGAFQISLGDTTGMGQPLQVGECSRKAVETFGVERIALHLHDTRGLGQTNAFAAFSAGVRNFDSSVGGLGGCPYAPGAAGNLATDSLLNLLQSMNVQTGVDAALIAQAGRWLEDSVGFRLRRAQI